MSGCLTQSDVQELGNSFLSDFDSRFDSISPDLCAPFTQEARNLESNVTTMYKIVVKMARPEENLEVVADLWKGMVFLCDEALKRIEKLAKEHPYCAADQYLHRLSDLRNKCRRLHTMHS